MNEIEKVRQEEKKKESQRKDLLDAVHAARQKLFSALGIAVSRSTNDTLQACNAIVEMEPEKRAEFIVQEWSQAHLERVDGQLQRLRMAEEQLRAFSG